MTPIDFDFKLFDFDFKLFDFDFKLFYLLDDFKLKPDLLKKKVAVKHGNYV